MIKRTFILLLIAINGFSQIKTSQKPVGKFLADSIHLGELIYYSVVFKHQANQEVFFTDKSYNYQPFEFVDKFYFPTETKAGISTDSAVFQLRTFNIKPVQYISIPIYLLGKNDSISLFSERDSVFLVSEIKGNIANLTLKDNAKLIPMKVKVNLFQLFLQIGTIVLIAVLWWLIFGNIVKSQLKIFSIYRSHNEFKKTFNRYTNTVSKANLVKALTHWKRYMGKLQKKSFKTMTTPEIINEMPDENLADALKEIDKSIYGNEISEKIKKALETLSNLSDKQYMQNKLEYSIKNKIVRP
jgi:hypothetical protein